jgi:hypothetical protein
MAIYHEVDSQATSNNIRALTQSQSRCLWSISVRPSRCSAATCPSAGGASTRRHFFILLGRLALEHRYRCLLPALKAFDSGFFFFLFPCGLNVVLEPWSLGVPAPLQRTRYLPGRLFCCGGLSVFSSMRSAAPCRIFPSSSTNPARRTLLHGFLRPTPRRLLLRHSTC